MLPLSIQIVEKRYFSIPSFREGIPQISDMHFQIALTSERVPGFG